MPSHKNLQLRVRILPRGTIMCRTTEFNWCYYWNITWNLKNHMIYARTIFRVWQKQKECAAIAYWSSLESPILLGQNDPFSGHILNKQRFWQRFLKYIYTISRILHYLLATERPLYTRWFLGEGLCIVQKRAPARGCIFLSQRLFYKKPDEIVITVQFFESKKDIKKKKNI